MKAQTYVILSILFVIIVAIFAVLNVSAVEVNYFFWKGDSPLILVILFSVLMGGLITIGAGLLKYVRLQRQNKSLRAEIKSLEIELDHYRLQEQPASLQEPLEQRNMLD